MPLEPSWEDLAREFERIPHAGEPFWVIWFAYEGCEDRGLWHWRPDDADTDGSRATFSLIAARAIEKLKIAPDPIPTATQYFPTWRLYCKSEEEFASIAANRIDMSDAIPFGLGDEDRDAVDPCTRAWFELLRKKSRAFRASHKDESIIRGQAFFSSTGILRNVCIESATLCKRFARVEIKERLIRAGGVPEQRRDDTIMLGTLPMPGIVQSTFVIGNRDAEPKQEPNRPDPPAENRSRRERKGDGTLLSDKRLVTFQTAEQYLGISGRQRQKLIKAQVLKVEGKGQNRRITAQSLKAYLPEENPN